LDIIILTPDMFVLRYHKYIMVGTFPARPCGLAQGTSPGRNPGKNRPFGRWEKNHREIPPSTGLLFYYNSRLTYRYRPDRSEEAYDGF
jgi:hypothetical protein